MNDLDLLMQRVDEINSKSPLDLSIEDMNVLIAYHRRMRLKKSSRGKELDEEITKIILAPQESPKQSTFKRRF